MSFNNEKNFYELLSVPNFKKKVKKAKEEERGVPKPHVW